ncbi:phage tail protein [Pseudomonas sp. SP16.1]|uniref:phage tail protein n=1 Tax=Pseudomonas sp. SP16.1 TaxID=3458854 RepID=UPI00404533D2
MSEPFLGEIRMVGFNFAPQGWAFCQGQIMSIAQNTALFSLLGTMYGGNGQTTFGLPDLQGRSPVGIGQGPGLSPIVQGEMAGTETVTLLTSNMPAHNHALPAENVPVSVTGPVAVPVSTTTASVGSPANAVPAAPSSGGRPFAIYNSAQSGTDTLAPFNVTLTGSAAVPANTTGISGSNIPVPLRNPYIGINFVIALQGIFPSHS